MKIHNGIKYAVVGGLGALAGTDVLSKVINAAPVRTGREHLDITFVQHPFEDEAGEAHRNYDPTHRKFYVYDTIRAMEMEGRDVVLLPCFISSTFLPEIAPETRLRLPDIVEAMRIDLETHYPDKTCVGILTSDYVRGIGHFERTLGDRMQVVYPDAENQALLMDAVYGKDGIKAGTRASAAVEAIVRASVDVIAQGAQIILPGFTELPTVLSSLQEQIPVPVPDCNRIYAEFAVGHSPGSVPAPFKIGVVGGVGPAATVDFMDKVIAATDADQDQDHIKMVVDHNPQIPDRTLNLIGDGSDPTIALYACCKRLEARGVQLVAIPCNTAHAYVERVQKYLTVPIVNMLQATLEHIREAYPDILKVGILATDGTLKSGLYQGAVTGNGLTPLVPDNGFQQLVMEVIYGPRGVKAGHTSGFCVEQLKNAIGHLGQKGAEAIVLGCTELPIIAPGQSTSPDPILIDPTRILADKCVEYAANWDHAVTTDTGELNAY